MCPPGKLLQSGQHRLHVFFGAGGNSQVVGIGQTLPLQRLREGVSAGIGGLDPSDEPLYCQVKNEWTEGTTLLDPSCLRYVVGGSLVGLDREGRSLVNVHQDGQRLLRDTQLLHSIPDEVVWDGAESENYRTQLQGTGRVGLPKTTRLSFVCRSCGTEPKAENYRTQLQGHSCLSSTRSSADFVAFLVLFVPPFVLLRRVPLQLALGFRACTRKNSYQNLIEFEQGINNSKRCGCRQPNTPQQGLVEKYRNIHSS